MKKLFKFLTVTVLAVAAAVACFAIAACSDKNGGNADYDYTFTIYCEDGTTPLNGQTGGANGGKVATQICLPGENGMCVRLNNRSLVGEEDIFPDENGKLGLTQEQVNKMFLSETDVTEFTFHVMNVPGYKDDCEITVNGKSNDYKITLSK